MHSGKRSECNRKLRKYNKYIIIFQLNLSFQHDQGNSSAKFIETLKIALSPIYLQFTYALSYIKITQFLSTFLSNF